MPHYHAVMPFTRQIQVFESPRFNPFFHQRMTSRRNFKCDEYNLRGNAVSIRDLWNPENCASIR